METINNDSKQCTYIGYIYIIENLINNKKYVGKTARNVKQRWAEHRSDAKTSDHYLYRAMRKYGINNFKIHEIEKIEDYELDEFNNRLSNLEIYYILFYNTHDKGNGYNETVGGDGVCGYKLSNDAKERMSIQRKGRKLTPEWKNNISNAFKGDKNPLFGTHLSDETKQKISESNIGKHTGIQNGMYGKKREDLSQRNKIGSKQIYQIDKCSKEVIHIWESLRECTRQTGFNRSCISDCCNGTTKQSHGFIWRYVDINNKNEIGSVINVSK